MKKILLLIIASLIVSIYIYTCEIKIHFFDFSEINCKQHNEKLKTSIKQLIDNLENVFSNSSDSCIPQTLRNILIDRFCGSNGSNTKIKIFCREKEKKFVGRKTVRCIKNGKVKYEVVYNYKKRKGGALGTDEIEIAPSDLKSKSIDEIEFTLYHELIHISENWYGEQKYGEKD